MPIMRVDAPAWCAPLPRATPWGKEVVAMEVAIAIQALALLFAILALSQHR
jgi:hypothetical protein